MKTDLTQGSMLKNLIKFSLPYLLSCFLQTFYGLTDLFITGQFNGADTITAVSVGSQITHMLTVVIVGLAMGTTVIVGHGVGAKKREKVSKTIGNTVTLFSVFGVLLMLLLIACLEEIVAAVSTPAEAVAQTKDYLLVCFLGIPFITAYNVISSIFRGLGDSKTPMYFVAVAGVINVILDYVFIGPLAMGAKGAALATVIAQGCSVGLTFFAMLHIKPGFAIHLRDFVPEKETMFGILQVGIPIAAQDGFIQISFFGDNGNCQRTGSKCSCSRGNRGEVNQLLFSGSFCHAFFRIGNRLPECGSGTTPAEQEGALLWYLYQCLLWFGSSTVLPVWRRVFACAFYQGAGGGSARVAVSAGIYL